MHFVGFKLHRGSSWLCSQRQVAVREEDEGSVREPKVVKLGRGELLEFPLERQCLVAASTFVWGRSASAVGRAGKKCI